MARYVEKMAELVSSRHQDGIVSYNNASLSVAGRMIEMMTGETYERGDRRARPRAGGPEDTLFFPNDIMTRRFVVGHRREKDGTVRVLRPWAMARSGNPWAAGPRPRRTRSGGPASTSTSVVPWTVASR